MAIFEVVMRTVQALVVLFILARFVGKKQVSQMTFFNYVTATVFSSMTAVLALERNISPIDGVVCLVASAALTYLSEYLNLKFIGARHVIDGVSVQ